MKKIILISLVSLALFGCGEKKVTVDMLIGDWECKQVEQNAKWKNGVFQDYEPPVEHGTFLAKYLKEDDNLFLILKLPDRDEKIKQNFKKLNESHEYFIHDTRIADTNKLVYISGNEFKWVYENAVTQDDSEDNVKVKVMRHCIRIK